MSKDKPGDDKGWGNTAKPKDGFSPLPRPAPKNNPGAVTKPMKGGVKK